MTYEKLRDSERWPWLFGGIRPVNCAGAVRDTLAGLVALLTAGCLLLARLLLFEIGFPADFLSQTVLASESA